MTPGTNIRKPSISKLCEWIIQVWELITRETVKKSSKKLAFLVQLMGPRMAWWAADIEDDVLSEPDVSEKSDENGDRSITTICVCHYHLCVGGMKHLCLFELIK